MNLKQRMKQGPVFGFAIFTGAQSVIVTVGNWGYGFNREICGSVAC